MRTRLRGWAVGAVTVTMAASLAACGGDDGGSSKSKGKAEDTGKTEQQAASPLHVMTAAAKKTDEAQSAKFTMTISVAGEPGKMTAKGAMSWGETPAMDMTMSGSGAMAEGMSGEFRIIRIGSTMYMDMGAENAMADGKRWMKIDMEAAAKASGNKALQEKLTSQMQETRQSPAEQMNMMLASPEIHLVGKEKVDGVPARHYRGSMTLDQILDAQKGKNKIDPAERQKLVDSMKKQGVDSADIDVWVNSDDLPVRIDVAMDAKEGTTKVSEHLSDYGADVSPKAPPADKTFDLQKMLQEMGAAGAGAGAA